MFTTRAYILGFVLSVACTLSAVLLYLLGGFTNYTFPTHTELRVAFVILLILQVLVQLLFFLHLSREPKQRPQFITLSLTVFIVVVIIGGTLWIMRNLAYHMQKTSVPYIHNTVTAQYEND